MNLITLHLFTYHFLCFCMCFTETHACSKVSSHLSHMLNTMVFLMFGKLGFLGFSKFFHLNVSKENFVKINV